MTNTSETRLNSILEKLCEGIEVPQVKDESSQIHNQEYLLEIIESQNYPYSLLHCPHLEEKGIGEDCVECQFQQYETYKSRFLTLAAEKGNEHVHTLKAAFDYYSSLITQYRLTECDELLDKIYSTCVSRGNWSSFYILAIQARAFLRFKQGRYEESLDYFHKQIDLQGPNQIIYENMALAYSRLNQPNEASTAYARAILLIRQQSQDNQKLATLLLGLSTVLENPEDALAVLEESLKMLQIRYDKPHSLMAKTLGAMGDLHMKQQNLIKAEKCYSEAVRIFIDTCGLETPLTSNAMHKHARSLTLLNEKQKAIDTFIESLNIWAKVDNDSFEPNAIVEALLTLTKIYEDDPSLGKMSNELILALESIQRKIENSSLADDLNTACLLKFITEMYIRAGDIPRAIACSKSFRGCLLKLNPQTLGELAPYRDKLLEETTQLLRIMETIKK